LSKCVYGAEFIPTFYQKISSAYKLGTFMSHYLNYEAFSFLFKSINISQQFSLILVKIQSRTVWSTQS